MATITQRYVIDHVPSEVFSVRFSHDGLLLATGCNDGVVRVYNGKTGAPLHALSPNPKHRPAALLFPPSSISSSVTNGTNAGSGPSTSTPSTALPTEEINEMEEEYDPERGFEAPPMPITALRFRPVTTNSNLRNILLTCSADGIIRHWHVPSARILSSIQEDDNQIFAADYRNDGLFFATGGKDKAVRVYDETRLDINMNNNSSTTVNPIVNKQVKPLLTMRGGGGYGSVTLGNDDISSMAGGHSNRIFGISWHPTDSHILISGGWDNTVQFYDTRVGHSVRSIYGPHICGDALSFTPDGSMIITGSWRPDDVLQIWDYTNGQCIMSVPWLRGNNEVPSYLHSVAGIAATQNGQRSSPIKATLMNADNGSTVQPLPPYVKADPCMLYSTTCSRTNSTVNTTVGNNNILIFAGGSGTNGGKIFRLNDILNFQTEITNAKQNGASKGTYTLPVPNPVDPKNIHNCKPLVATVSGLPRGVYGSDWDGNNGMVIVGGDQPIRVFDINPIVINNSTTTNTNDATNVNTKGLVMTPPPKTKGSKLRSRLPRGGIPPTESTVTTTNGGGNMDVPPPTVPTSPDAGTTNTVSMIPPQPPLAVSTDTTTVTITVPSTTSTEPSVPTTIPKDNVIVVSDITPINPEDEDLDAVFGTDKADEEEGEEEEEEEENNDIDNGAVFDAGFSSSPNGRPTSAGRLGSIGSPKNRRSSSHAVQSLRNTIEQSRGSTTTTISSSSSSTGGMDDNGGGIGIARTEPIEGVTDKLMTPADEAILLAQYGGAESENVSDAESIEAPAVGETITTTTNSNAANSNIGATVTK